MPERNDNLPQVAVKFEPMINCQSIDAIKVIRDVLNYELISAQFREEKLKEEILLRDQYREMLKNTIENDR